MLSFPSGVTLKNIGERKLKGLKNRCGGSMYDFVAASTREHGMEYTV
jgi:hypothetical protein